jgi:hypothetical protein
VEKTYYVGLSLFSDPEGASYCDLSASDTFRKMYQQVPIFLPTLYMLIVCWLSTVLFFFFLLTLHHHSHRKDGSTVENLGKVLFILLAVTLYCTYGLTLTFLYDVQQSITHTPLLLTVWNRVVNTACVSIHIVHAYSSWHQVFDIRS